MNLDLENHGKIIDDLKEKAFSLENAENWKALILVCMEWLQHEPNDLEALKLISIAYQKDGDTSSVDHYCSLALNILSPDSLNRKPFEVIQQRNLINKNIPRQSPNLAEPAWYAFIKPDFDLNQDWINDAELVELDKQLINSLSHFEPTKFAILCNACWREINSSFRRYEVPSKGRIEIQTTERINQLMNIVKVRFIQEGAVAPEIYVRLEFTGSKIGVLKIDSDGNVSGFHEKMGWALLVINALVLTYYRDLVVPMPVEHEPRFPRHRIFQPKEQSHNSIESKARSFPTYYPKQSSVYEFREWHIAQHRARHAVRGHVRWIARGFHAEPEKRLQAKMAGIDLELGFTWVIEHERGGHDEVTRLVLDGTDLTQRTLFSPPARAKNELDDLLYEPNS